MIEQFRDGLRIGEFDERVADRAEFWLEEGRGKVPGVAVTHVVIPLIHSPERAAELPGDGLEPLARLPGGENAEVSRRAEQCTGLGVGDGTPVRVGAGDGPREVGRLPSGERENRLAEYAHGFRWGGRLGANAKGVCDQNIGHQDGLGR